MQEDASMTEMPFLNGHKSRDFELLTVKLRDVGELSIDYDVSNYDPCSAKGL